MQMHDEMAGVAHLTRSAPEPLAPLGGSPRGFLEQLTKQCGALLSAPHNSGHRYPGDSHA
jgi:hypothetical protein